MKLTGDLFLEAEAELLKKYENTPEVKADLILLTGLLASWYTEVFVEIIQEMNACPECSKVDAVIEKLNWRKGKGE
jgi:hypothetical protein